MRLISSSIYSFYLATSLRAILLIALILSGPACFLASASTWSITIKAIGPDGTNTRTARLLSPLKLDATLHAGSYEQVGWKLKGAGSLRTNGPQATYTPPASMPADGSVTITAYAVSYPSLTTSYTFTVLYPIPAISYNSPLQLPGGATTSVKLTGKNFLPGTSLLASVGTVKTVYSSSGSLTAQVTLPANATGTLLLRARNPTPGGGTTSAVKLPIWSIQLKGKNSEGTNTGTVRLGVPLSLTPMVDAGGHKEVKWKLSGPGKLSAVDTEANAVVIYTPPQTMPSGSDVTVTAYMASYPAAAAKYSFSLINPIPAVSSSGGVSPYTVLTGATQAVSVTGSGFVAGTRVLHNSLPLATTFIDYHHLTVHVPVKDTADGNIKMQVMNPSPGGGPGSTFQVVVAANSIQLKASSEAGVNSGYAEPGGRVIMTAAVTGSAKTAVTWKISGAGTISSSGVYIAPNPISDNNVVKISAALTSNPAITASYSLDLLNPTPVITKANPAQVPAGEATELTLSGSGFMRGTVLVPSSGTATTTYHSSTSLTVTVKLADGARGTLELRAKNPSPGGGLGPYFQEAIAAPVSTTAAARILDQTTFGPTKNLIKHVKLEGVTGWLEEQFNTPTTRLANIPTPHPADCRDAAFPCVESEWWRTVLTGSDQLRQRVAFALSELFVISTNEGVGMTLPTYANMLADDAFGNWFQLMKDVTRSPGMGMYLDMLNSAAGGDGKIANENFARENMQLFNLGLNLIHQDGTLILDASGRPQPTYTEAQVRAFARAFTGWTYANSDGSTPNIFIGTPNVTHHLVAVEARHDTSAKTLLNGTILPAGQSAEEDLDGALINIFQHPNLPPFVSRQLIQHLVTGHPSPAYVSRVASVFKDNGNHVRGDLRSVLTAIFTDPEARAGDQDEDATAGHLREPILWVTGVMRALGYVNVSRTDFYYQLSRYSGVLNQQPYTAASVFNFFPPGYVIPRTKLNEPEFALENTASVVDRMALADTLVSNRVKDFNVDLSASSPLGQLAANPTDLVDELETIFLHGRMSPDARTVILNEVKGLSSVSQRVRVATYLVITSAEYKIMH